jgi:MinD-like ATPase involved in chromosome partitioning or flagellar assembly
VTSVAVCSTSGAPGVTTVACALGAVWPADRSVVVVEADPSGGALAARFGLDPQRGTTSFVIGHRHGPQAVTISEHCQQLPGGLSVLVGPVGAEPARVVDGEADVVVRLLQHPGDVLVDGGRIVPGAAGQQRLLGAVDVVIVVVVAERSAVANLATAMGRLRSIVTGRLGVAVVTDRPSVAVEAAARVGADLAGRIPWDPRAAAVVRGEPRRTGPLARTGLMRAAAALYGWVSVSSPSPVPPPVPQPSVPQAPLPSVPQAPLPSVPQAPLPSVPQAPSPVQAPVAPPPPSGSEPGPAMPLADRPSIGRSVSGPGGAGVVRRHEEVVLDGRGR